MRKEIKKGLLKRSRLPNMARCFLQLTRQNSSVHTRGKQKVEMFEAETIG
mgnify:CR=1 FL=1